MTFTAVGVAVPPLGFARQVYAVPGGEAGFDVRRRFYSVDPLRLRTNQPARIPVDLEHSHVLVGEVRHLEVAHNGALWAVAEMHGPLPETSTPLYWSVASTSLRDGSDVVLDRIAVTERPAMIGAEPIRFLPGELREHSLRYHWPVGDLERGVLQRATEAWTRRGRDIPIEVGDVDRARREEREDREERELYRRAGGQLHYGPRGRVLRVR